MKVYETRKQIIDLRNISFDNPVLDIGGGGEGIISRLSDNLVVAIDKHREELEETPDIGIKLIMDACELKFLSKSFENITCFYSLMYMQEYEIVKFLHEAYRVLRVGGSLWIWDISIPLPAKADVFVAQLDVIISNEQSVSMGYGVTWNRKQSLETVQRLCEQAGFILQESLTGDQAFFLRLRRN